MRKYLAISLILGFLISASAYSQDTPPASEKTAVNEHLKPFLPFVGKTWQGQFADSTAKEPMVDVSRWELILNGQAIRVMHSVNDGIYGGETIIYWDKDKQQLLFFYFTTAGFYTTGTFSIEGTKFISHERVTGNQNGITEVKATGELLPDGRLRSKSQYLQNGQWVDGHEIFYRENPMAKVIFK